MSGPDKEAVYRQLEAGMLSYTDYANVPVEPINEALVPIPDNPDLTARQIGTDMLPYTGEQVHVRRSVLRRLGRAATSLTERQPDLQLEVVYGYRALEIQEQLFKRYKAKLQCQYEGEELLAATHRLISVPEVAGHPAGAAVDLQIIQEDQPLDFGTRIWEFTPDSFTFSPFISETAKANRQLLRQTMMQAGFAPFDGEWWHFSYGDKEWAKYHNQPAALYEQAEFKAVSH